MNCIGMLEYKSISAGVEACDAALKAADVSLLYSMPVCAGKYIILFRGEVGAVKSSVETASEVATELLIDSIVIPNLHDDVFPALTASTVLPKIDAVGVVESFSIAASIIAADAALKAADIRMIEIRLAKGLGGKSFFTFTGEVGAVRESEKVAVKYLEEEGFLVYSMILPNPHPELAENLY